MAQAEPIETCVKDPDARLPFVIDWARFLPSGETIDSVVWSAPSADLTIESDSNTDTTATAVISGCLAGHVYRVTCQVTTVQAAYVDERSIEIEVLER